MDLENKKPSRVLSETKRGEQPIPESEERYRQMVDSVKDYAIFLLDKNGIVSSWNAGAERLKGYKAEEIIGKHFSVFYPEEDNKWGKTQYELSEAALTGRFEDEGWRLRKDGTRFWANVVITALRNKKGEVSGFSKVTRDLTERKRAEERLRKVNESLERRVAERTLELTKAKDELEQALYARDEFMSIASHELKTPITSMRLQVQVLQVLMKKGKDELLRDDTLPHALDTLLRQTSRLSSLIEDLLDVSRARLGKLTFEFENADLSSLVEGVVNQWREPLSKAHCTLTTDIQPGISGYADPYRLEQVLINLITNTIKYAPGAPIHVELHVEHQAAVFKVSDSGPGIHPEKHTRIFERYERAAVSPSVSGLGLGLYIAKTIVEAHHGTIQIESRQGKGATFSVRIPLNVKRVENA